MLPPETALCFTGHLGLSALQAACLCGHLGAARVLLQAGANPNRCDSEGGTPLFTAVDDGYTEIARELLAHGANVNHRTISGATPLMCAAAAGWIETEEYLIGSGADMDAIDSDGLTALAWAEENGCDDVVAVPSRDKDTNTTGGSTHRIDVTQG